MIRYVPNILTVLRILTCPILVVLLARSDYRGALILFFLAGVSDALDGYIAKRFDCVTRLGSLLDPLADKLLIICAMLLLTISGDLPRWLLGIVVLRDCIILLCWFILTRQHTTVHMRPSYLSKINTVLQIVLVLLVLADRAQLLTLTPAVEISLILTVFATTLASGLQYLWVWMIRRGPDAVGELRR